MEIFVSLSELLENQKSLNSVKDEIYTMKMELKSYMDKGLDSDAMLMAKKESDAILAAEGILEKL